MITEEVFEDVPFTKITDKSDIQQEVQEKRRLKTHDAKILTGIQPKSSTAIKKRRY